MERPRVEKIYNGRGVHAMLYPGSTYESGPRILFTV